jgi:hypothetical protein
MLVPEVGIEPTHLAVPDFESGASTSSTTRARAGFYSEIVPSRQAKSLAWLRYLPARLPRAAALIRANRKPPWTTTGLRTKPLQKRQCPLPSSHGLLDKTKTPVALQAASFKIWPTGWLARQPIRCLPVRFIVRGWHDLEGTCPIAPKPCV